MLLPASRIQQTVFDDNSESLLPFVLLPDGFFTIILQSVSVKQANSRL